jgi:hypothetical protein
MIIIKKNVDKLNLQAIWQAVGCFFMQKRMEPIL